MSNFIKTIIILVVTIFIISIFFIKRYDWQPKSNKSDIVEIHYADHISEAHKKVIDLFNQRNRDKIRVIPVDLPFVKFTTNERKEILARSLRSKNDRIDIFAIDLIWGPRFAKWSLGLEPFIDDSLLNHYSEHSLKSCYFEGRLIALPLYTDVGLMYFRKDILEKAGVSQEEIKKIKNSITWSEFINLGFRLKKLNLPYFVFSADNFEGMICSFHETLTPHEIETLFLNEQIQLFSEPAQKGLQLMVDLIHKYKFTPFDVLQFDEQKSRDFALAKDAIFLRGWPGFFKNTTVPDTFKHKVSNFEIAPLPHMTSNDKNAVFGGWNLMISKYSKNKSAALKFIKFTSTTEIQKILYQKGGFFPVLKSFFLDTVFTMENPDILFVQRLMKKGKHRPFRKDYTRISDIMSYYFHKALEGKLSVNEALKTASDKINSKQVFIK